MCVVSVSARSQARLLQALMLALQTVTRRLRRWVSQVRVEDRAGSASAQRISKIGVLLVQDPGQL